MVQVQSRAPIKIWTVDIRGRCAGLKIREPWFDSRTVHHYKYAQLTDAAVRPVLKTVGTCKGMGIDTSVVRHNLKRYITYGRVGKLVTPPDCKSGAVGSAGSSPASPTNPVHSKSFLAGDVKGSIPLRSMVRILPAIKQ